MTQFALRYREQVVLLKPGEFRVGRAKESDLWIKDRMVSRCHLILRVSSDAVEIEDVGSKNGVWINGRKAGQALLQDGDLLTVGGHELRFTLVTEVRRRTTTGPMGLRPVRSESKSQRSAGEEANAGSVHHALRRREFQEAESALYRCLGWIAEVSRDGLPDNYRETVQALAIAALELGRKAERWDPLVHALELIARYGEVPNDELLRGVEEILTQLPRSVRRGVAACLTILLSSDPEFLENQRERITHLLAKARAEEGMSGIGQ